LKRFVFAAAFAALLPALGIAAPDAADAAADPAAPVPRVNYRSVFQDVPAGVEESREDWRKANAEVGQFRRGHIDLLKWEAAQPAEAPPSGNGATSPAKPAPPSAHKH
jgi:hypothetical protein